MKKILNLFFLSGFLIWSNLFFAQDNDFRENAWDISHLINTCSALGEFTTEYGTPDGPRPSGWIAGPNYNKWFKFQASMVNE